MSRLGPRKYSRKEYRDMGHEHTWVKVSRTVNGARFAFHYCTGELKAGVACKDLRPYHLKIVNEAALQGRFEYDSKHPGHLVRFLDGA